MHRLKIAYFSPLPPTRSGIADYSSELLPYLAEHADITLFSADPNKVDNTLAEQFPIEFIDHYPENRWQFDIPFYQMGNSAHHDALYQMFLRYPGIVTLHDYVLHHFIAQRTINSNYFAGYIRELGYELGSQGVEFARQGKMGESTRPVHTIPLNGRLLDLSLGIVVHSHYAKNLILDQRKETAVTVIPQHMTTVVEKSLRQQLPWPKDAVIFASAGQITIAKQIEFALHAFKKIRQNNLNAYYLIIGEEMDDVDLSGIISTLNLSECVQHIGYVANKEEFIGWIYTADIIINLRFPTIGETSATALRALAEGRPLILFDHGWYSELPDSTCIKVPPLDEEALITAMLQLLQHPQKRQLLGKSGQQHIKNKFHPKQIAHANAAFIRQQLCKFKHKYEI